MYRLALIVKLKGPHHFTLLLTPAAPPSSSLPSPQEEHEEEEDGEDTPLWDLPWVPLSPRNTDHAQEKEDPVSDVHSALCSIGITHLDTNLSVLQVHSTLVYVYPSSSFVRLILHQRCMPSPQSEEFERMVKIFCLNLPHWFGDTSTSHQWNTQKRHGYVSLVQKSIFGMHTYAHMLVLLHRYIYTYTTHVCLLT